MFLSIIIGLAVGITYCIILFLVQKDPYRKGYEDGWFDAIKQQRITESICETLDGDRTEDE